MGLSKNLRTAFVCVAVVAGMIGMSYAMVPLYDLFCRVTGFGGTTDVAEAAPEEILDREITVRFDASVSRDMVWKFTPEQVSQTVQVGETGLAFYRAVNPTGRPVYGTATFNVSPARAGAYFKKIECFCFTEQKLDPGEAMDMPVTYFIDPSIKDNPYLDGLTEVTLSYTFFDITDEAQQTAMLQ